MNKKIIGFIVVLIMLFTSQSFAETNQISGKAIEMTWPNNTWDGNHKFLKVFCATFPEPQSAVRLVQAMFNNNTAYISRVDYPNDLAVYIVTSTIPPGRNIDEEMKKLLSNEMQNQAVAPNFVQDVHSFTTSFGPTVSTNLINTSPNPKDGPFPLAKAVMANANRIVTVATTRLFAHGSNRFEIAVLKGFAKPSNEDFIRAAKININTYADQLLASLQSCTGKTE